MPDEGTVEFRRPVAPGEETVEQSLRRDVMRATSDNVFGYFLVTYDENGSWTYFSRANQRSVLHGCVNEALVESILASRPQTVSERPR